MENHQLLKDGNSMFYSELVKKAAVISYEAHLKDKDKAESLLNDLKIDARKRPEELSPQTYVDMYERIKVIS